MSSPKYLLIVSCGKKKSEDLKYYTLKAKDAYKGPIFQVINKAKREKRWPENLKLGIVSAKYGFLRSNDEITYYDLRMTKSLARKLHSQVIAEIRKWHEDESFSLIYILMGKDYLESIQGLGEYIKTEIIIENMGGLGVGQRKLVNFLDSLRNTKEKMRIR